MRDIINKLNDISEDQDTELMLSEEVVNKIADPDTRYDMIGEIKLADSVTDDEISKQIDDMFAAYWDNGSI